MKNYKLIEEKYLENEQSKALVLEHNKTKAKVFIMPNEDDNKVFGIGFRTPPKSSNGVCHIIEHCVLNGSKKYRTREPFMDMVKGSLNTFLNAMTYPDKTIYPVASRNDQDFRNLTDLYLDAVFNPKVKEDEKIFKQEGWRYHLEDDKLSYKGVVYNEMRGSMSSLESQVYRSIYKELQPDTIYAFNSGGDPYQIPSLSYGEFLDYYKEFYHPTNSYIFLYGNMDYEEYLDYIDRDYLSNYEYRDVHSHLEKQEYFGETRYSVNYLNTAKEMKPNEAFISYTTLLGDAEDSKIRILSNLVSSILINNESSPIKQRLMASGILDVIFSASQNTNQCSFSLVAKNINPENRDEFVNIIEEELEKIVVEGLDKDLVLAELNSYKFDLKEKGGYPTKGIAYFTNAFESWLYDQSPIDAIDIEKDLQYIENNLDLNLIENFIKNNILNSKHKSIVSHIPKQGLNAQKDKEVAELLEEKKNNLSQVELEDLEKSREEMEAFQNRENTEEEKATIPRLAKSDVNTHLPRIDRKVISKDTYTILSHDLPTSGVDYIDLVFDIGHINNPEEIMYTNLLTTVLGQMDTENYTYSDLNKAVYLRTGGISASVKTYKNYENDDFYKKVKLSTKIFTENIKEASDLIKEILTKTKFDNLNRLKEIILEIKAYQEIGLYQSAHALMMTRASSNHLAFFKYNEYVNGIDYMLFIKELAEKDPAEIAEKLEDTYNKIFARNKLLVNVASTFENEELLGELENLAESFENKIYEEKVFEFTAKKKSEGFSTSADVNYVSYGNNLNMDFDSKLIVLNNLVSNEYLYSEIRAKGGAYGAGMVARNVGNFATFSYRDPNLERTLDIYRNIPTYLENVKLSEKDLLPYIIGAVGRIDPPLTEKMKSNLDMSLYISNDSIERIENDIENALNADMDYIKSQANNLRNLLDTSSLAILGNKNTIEENKDLFDEIIEL